MEGRILVVSLGEIDGEILNWLKLKLLEKFGKKVEIIFGREEIEFAYNPKRKQFHSTSILRELQKIEKDKEDFVLGIVDRDLYVPELNFVFGEADILNKVAVIGLVRLREEFYNLPPNQELFLERILKEAVHEIGHLYGFKHCVNPKCVMFFSNTLLDTDRKSVDFCSKHKIK